MQTQIDQDARLHAMADRINRIVADADGNKRERIAVELGVGAHVLSILEEDFALGALATDHRLTLVETKHLHDVKILMPGVFGEIRLSMFGVAILASIQP